MPTIIHVTHESIDHLGGIGTVLQGLIASADYRAAVARSVLVGPLPYADRPVTNPVHRLGEHALACLYSGPDRHDPHGLGAIFAPVEWAFGTKLVYGTRTFHAPGDESQTATAEVLLFDVNRPCRDRLAETKWRLHELHGIESHRYEQGWDYEEYVRLAAPAYHALCALLRQPAPGAGASSLETGPALVIAHEFMGVPTALLCAADRARFRTLFHAHECSTARKLTEGLPGFDCAFYPEMNRAIARGQSVGEVFGDQSDFGRHALVSRTHVLDGIMAVGPETAAELRFLSPQMRTSRTRVVYNGLPSRQVTFDDKRRSRELVNAWLKSVLGYAPDYLVTHVTRPVPSKGLWRDVALLRHLGPHLARRNQTAAYVLLTCAAPVRSAQHVTDMAARYGWPRAHQMGYPDLEGPEVELARAIEALNAGAEGQRASGQRTPPVTGVLVNQFGFSPARLGPAAPAGLTTADLRRAADVELGMSTYEPFGIAQLEPLHAGAICVTSSVCGCMGLVQRAMRELSMTGCDLVLPADFAGAVPAEVSSPMAITDAQRREIEDRLCAQLAGTLAQRLPTTDAQRQEHLRIGQRLSAHMSWDHVVRHDFLPAVREAMARGAHD